ncbi:MAG: thiamine phosphate synthase [Deltaproteobacteria bacterium]|nr:thiamine phosphate synthase [Deltaproteobacteria bacterium]
MKAPRLLLLTPAEGSLDPLRAALNEVAGAADAAVLLRRPGASDRRLLAEAASLRGPLPLLIHRRPDLVRLAGAAGVHLPERGLPVHEARSLLGEDAIVGVSRHDASGLAAADGADYATLSPFFHVAGKNPPLGPEGFRAARASAPEGLLVLALGGLSPETCASAFDAGADGIAVLRGAQEARRLLDIVRARKG